MSDQDKLFLDLFAQSHTLFIYAALGVEDVITRTFLRYIHGDDYTNVGERPIMPVLSTLLSCVLPV